MTRQEANKKILEVISDYVEKCPDMRFWQLLYNLNIVRGEPFEIQDDFSRESVEILNNLRKPTVV